MSNKSKFSKILINLKKKLKLQINLIISSNINTNIIIKLWEMQNIYWISYDIESQIAIKNFYSLFLFFYIHIESYLLTWIKVEWNSGHKNSILYTTFCFYNW